MASVYTEFSTWGYAPVSTHAVAADFHDGPAGACPHIGHPLRYCLIYVTPKQRYSKV